MSCSSEGTPTGQLPRTHTPMPSRDQQIPTNRRLHVLHVSVPTAGGVATVATGYVRDPVSYTHLTLPTNREV